MKKLKKIIMDADETWARAIFSIPYEETNYIEWIKKNFPQNIVDDEYFVIYISKEDLK